MMVERVKSSVRTVEILKPEQKFLRRHNMKKLLAMLLALCMVFALCACGQTAAPAADPAPAQTDAAGAASV